MPNLVRPTRDHYDALVIGGGFYGCLISLELAKTAGKVGVLETEEKLMTRASYVNQARVHNGYHYPRSYLTALRSAANFSQFTSEFRDCIDDGFEHVYAIARTNSKITAGQFRRFCSVIGAPLREAPRHVRALFNTQLIEDAFCVTEFAFDAEKLRATIGKRLKACGVEVFCGTSVRSVSHGLKGRVVVDLQKGECLTANRVIACVYASTNSFLRRSGLPTLPVKQELAEVALITVPDALKRVGVTVMDGPFFSTMPFPARDLHSLTHVRYTPHCSWWDQNSRTAHARGPVSSRYLHMLKDAQRYLPLLRDVCYQESLFEVKAIPIQNEVDDGRPIYFRKDYGVENFSIVMGSKIDNIYDALRALEAAGLVEGGKDGVYDQREPSAACR